jgi:hypothetical protein
MVSILLLNQNNGFGFANCDKENLNSISIYFLVYLTWPFTFRYL